MSQLLLTSLYRITRIVLPQYKNNIKNRSVKLWAIFLNRSDEFHQVAVIEKSLPSSRPLEEFSQNGSRQFPSNFLTGPLLFEAFSLENSIMDTLMKKLARYISLSSAISMQCLVWRTRMLVSIKMGQICRVWWILMSSNLENLWQEKVTSDYLFFSLRKVMIQCIYLFNLLWLLLSPFWQEIPDWETSGRPATRTSHRPGLSLRSITPPWRYSDCLQLPGSSWLPVRYLGQPTDSLQPPSLSFLVSSCKEATKNWLYSLFLRSVCWLKIFLARRGLETYISGEISI